MSAAGRPVSTVALFVVVDQKVELRAAKGTQCRGHMQYHVKVRRQDVWSGKAKTKGKELILVSAHAKGFESVAITS